MEWSIRPAVTISQRSGREVRAGWDLFYGEEWSQRYPNKRLALAALGRVRGTKP